MAIFSMARTITGAMCCLAALSLSTFPSDAAAKAKARKYIFDDLVTPSMMMATPTPSPAPQNGGARFFSINNVLAKLDGKHQTDEPVRLASVANNEAISDAPVDFINPGQSYHPTNEPFGLFTFRAPEGILWRKWRALQTDIDADMRQIESCKTNNSQCSDAARRFLLIVNEARTQDGTARIETVNRLINTAIRYMSDLSQHATVDVWSSPLASLSSGRGDCEDYAIAKYIVLREAGVSEQDLRILLVRDRKVREDHAVVSVRIGDTWIVLDNRNSALSEDRELTHFTPLYVLDNSGVNLFASPYLSRGQTGETAAISPASEPLNGEDSRTEWGNLESSGAALIGIGPGAATLPILM